MNRMDEKTINLRLHYEGQFKKTTYVGGKHLVLSAIEVESFSYSVLMEFVKDNLHYSEIGGIYANRGRKGGWQLLSNDKEVMELVEECAPGDLVNFYIDNIVDKAIEPAPQMQPHVITRPRENIIQGISISIYVCVCVCNVQFSHNSMHNEFNCYYSFP